MLYQSSMMNAINPLQIEVTDRALAQIKLILENDYTLTDKTLRISIDGKGCNGFDYAIGFDKKFENDKVIDQGDFQIVLDPFASHYCNQGELDYLFDIANDVEGFIFTNKNEKNYRGKFFKDESKAPDPKDLN
jgi:iron-sulfur cluster insertion protein